MITPGNTIGGCIMSGRSNRPIAWLCALGLAITVGCGKKGPVASEGGNPRPPSQTPAPEPGASGAKPTPQNPEGSEKVRLNFEVASIKCSVPAGWAIVDGRRIKTDVLVGPCQQHMDKFLKGGPNSACFLQQTSAAGVKPTICLLPGEDFIKGCPSFGSFRPGTRSGAKILAAEMAWLLVCEDGIQKVPDSVVGVQMMEFGDTKESAAKIEGETVILIGISLTERWKNRQLTIGLAAPPDSIKATKAVVGGIIAEIDGIPDAK